MRRLITILLAGVILISKDLLNGKGGQMANQTGERTRNRAGVFLLGFFLSTMLPSCTGLHPGEGPPFGEAEGMINSLDVRVEKEYCDGRPSARLRLEAKDYGIVLRHGDGPDECDIYGARDVWVFEADGTYYMHYDAAGPTGWLCSLATSEDTIHWKKRGPILELGKSGEDDSKGACYGVTYFDGKEWHMFYLGTPNTTPPPERIPAFPYLTMKAKGTSPAGPWIKQKEVIPFGVKPGTYYSVTASPGFIVEHKGEYLQFFSAAVQEEGIIKRTLGIARTKDLDGQWDIDPRPIVPLAEQIENSSLYYEESNKTWFLFTNHVGIDDFEYTDAIWVYWSKDLNKWNPKNKAVVLDGQNCKWSKCIIGLPSVLRVGAKLAIFYDGLEGSSVPPGVENHMRRDIGLAWLDLPLVPPARQDGAAANLSPTYLRCEYRVNPQGIDVVEPRLSWILESSQRGQKQTAYQLLVADSKENLKQNKGNLWDSGKVESDQSIHVVYEGKPLKSRMRCYWKVRVWDKDGKVSAWSELAMWSMGLLNKSDWSAKWISSPNMQIVEKAITMSKWFWHPLLGGDNKTAFFRTELYLQKEPPPHHGIIAISADDYTLYVNGVKVGEDDDLATIERYTLWDKGKFTAGKNVICVKVEDIGGPADLTLGIRMVYYGGQSEEVQPTNWLCFGEAPENWLEPDFEAQGWVKAKAIADYGDGPWGQLTQKFDGPRRSFQVRKDFALPSEITRACAYVSGLGAYRLHINGKRVGNDVLTPGWTLYSKRIQYQTYDVTDLLRCGENAVGAILGNCWWSSGLGWMGGHSRHAKEGENLRFIMQLEIDCADGSHHTIVTDNTWKSHFSPILEDTLYHGLTYDARLEMPGWDTAGFDDSKWTACVVLDEPLELLCAQKGPTLRVTRQLEPVNITEPSKGVYIFDFGQNHSGHCRLKVSGPAGAKIQIRHSEILKADGHINNVNYRSARVTDSYICKGKGVEVLEPLFTYRGFRYAEVTGLPSKPTKDTLISQVLHSAPPFTGRFECSNELINRILSNIVWGQISNMHSVPTDCPQRDERLGWMGDAQAFAPTSCWNMDMAMFWTKWMRDIVDSQHPNGATPGVCPTIVIDMPGRSGWADAVVVIPWVVYQFYGDKRVLEENYVPMKKWVEYIRANSEGNLYNKETWGDWVPVVETPDKPLSSAYGFYCTKLLSQMAKVLGKDKDAVEYAELAKKIAKAFNAKHLDQQTMNYINGTQTANLLPLCFGITERQDRQAVADNIIKDVIERGRHHSTGFLGTPLILPALTEFGRADLAYQVISSDEYPSLGYMVKKGATTIWERWNTDKMGPEMNSRNHFAFGSMGQWLYEALAGINIDPEEPGFKHIILRPRLIGDLSWAKANYNSIHGAIESSWKVEGHTFNWNVTIPANTTATVYVPAKDAKTVTEDGQPATTSEGVKFLRVEADSAVFAVGSGQYQFRARLSARPRARRGT